MKTSEVYSKYMTPLSLQKHMLRTAILAEILLEHWTGLRINKKAIINACIFHDIAKPMMFDLAKQAQYGMEEEEIKNLAELQKRIKINYGDNEHHATVMICKEIGLSDVVVHFVDNLEWIYIPRWLETNEIASLIPIYCDMRIGPKGILPLQERIKELYDRVGGESYDVDMKNGNLLEAKIKENVTIDVNGITTGQLDTNLESLLNLEI